MSKKLSDPANVAAYLSTLPAKSQIAYTEELLDIVARGIWGNSFNKEDKEKMKIIADKTLYGVKQMRELALRILEE